MIVVDIRLGQLCVVQCVSVGGGGGGQWHIYKSEKREIRGYTFEVYIFKSVEILRIHQKGSENIKTHTNEKTS